MFRNAKLRGERLAGPFLRLFVSKPLDLDSVSFGQMACILGLRIQNRHVREVERLFILANCASVAFRQKSSRSFPGTRSGRAGIVDKALGEQNFLLVGTSDGVVFSREPGFHGRIVILSRRVKSAKHCLL